ncbi:MULTISPECIES: SDR family oxidoreductase UcpA [Pseudocitrobacter]|uniref:SDR family oxidoreductase UcpA n=1 Tax=Pseudocitrobacter TaxID=1504576 RepID=UPI000D3CF946|nr:SDR family oxidoreductase UcpA [Pseudocitrobacter sp. RIT 415]RAU52935.1 oxidoreductase UcpA [Pseudocitrobacter sp. RIT 415]
MGKLTGKTALITGAYQGIGEGIARTFARHGANLILLDISDELEKLAYDLAGRGYRCTVVKADVRDYSAVQAAIAQAKERENKIDILVNNAGVCRLGGFLEMSEEDRDFHIDVNIKGVWNVTRAVLPDMVARGDGRIVMMSSVTGDMVADPGETAYAMSKAAIIGLTKSLAVEYAQSGIRVNAICPGYVRTPMAESIARQSNPEDPESVLTEMAKAIPMRRLANPLEVGELAAFLASDESSYLTGTQNVIDGGSTLPESVSVGI